MRPVFGEFLGPAGAHITAAVSIRDELPDAAKYGAIRQLDRLASTLARYMSGLGSPDELGLASSPPPEPDARTALEARIALRRAAGDEQAWKSCWAPLVASGPVTAALLAELAGYARQLAPWVAQLSVTSPMNSGMPGSACIAMHVASRWIWMAGISIESAHRQHPPPVSARRLLYSIPANVSPSRRPPEDPEPVPELCEGITITSERLRHAAVAFATQARLAGAADAMAKVWPACRAVAHQWDIASTGPYIGAGISPVAAEFGDLALRIGRLAYRNPQWTPDCAEASLVRLPEDLAPSPDDIGSVLSAAHHAVDAVARIAIEGREAARGGRSPHRSVPAP